jgi:hexulose-6-phosphate isomerase
MSRELSSLNRRQFLTATALATGVGAAVIGQSHTAAAAPKRNIVKSLKMGMIAAKGPNDQPFSVQDRLQMAKDAGFASVEPDTIGDAKEVENYRTAAEKVGIKLDAIICSAHWSSPLSDPDPAVYEITMESMRTSMQNAKDMGGDMVLLVPAVVSPKVQYGDAWTRSVERIKILAEDADRIGVTIGIENVWNKFLLSPLEAKHYIEEINHPRVRFWFDVGNVVRFGYPQDWIRTLGPLIARVDIKDFHTDLKDGFVPLREGSVDWPEVMRAFDEIGYQGVFAAEVAGGDTEYLRTKVSDPMDAFIAM